MKKSEFRIINVLIYVVPVLLLMFCIFGLYGPVPHESLDSESNVSVLRFLKGDVLSAIYLNRSPILNVNSPYGGWPPLHLLVHSFIANSGLDISISRLLSNMCFIIIFAMLGTYVITKWYPKASVFSTFVILLLSPAITRCSGLGVAHITIPLGLVLPWAAAEYIQNKHRTVKVLVITLTAFVMGLTDYAIVGYTFIVGAMIIAKLVNREIGNTEQSKRLLCVCIMTCIALIVTMVYIVSQRLIYHDVQVSIGASNSKLLERLTLTIPSLLLTAYYGVVRALFCIIPLFIYSLVATDRSRPRSLTIDRMVPICPPLWLLWGSCIWYMLLFTGLCWVPSHYFICLTMVFVSAVTITKHFSLRSITWLRQVMALITMIMFSFMFLKGGVLLPKYVWEFSSYQGYSTPLPPSNYFYKPKHDRDSNSSFSGLIRTSCLQMFTLPLESYTTRRNNNMAAIDYWFDQNSKRIMLTTHPDDIIVVYGNPSTLFVISQTDRLIKSVNTNKEMNDVVSHYPENRICIIAPTGSHAPDGYHIYQQMLISANYACYYVSRK